MPSPLLSTNLLFLYLCERGHEHILISRFHISDLPAAPSLVVQPWLGVRLCAWSSVSEYTCKTAAHINACTPGCKLTCAADDVSVSMHDLTCLCVVLFSSFSLCRSVRCCHLLFDKITALLDQSHVGHKHSSARSVDELIPSFVSISSIRCYSVLCYTEEEGRWRRSILAEIAQWFW